VAAAVLTPRQTAGPFYPKARPADHDLDLTQVDGRQARAAGDVIELSGRVFHAGGAPLGDGVVEIWQANTHGRYAHPGDPGGSESDPNFQGFGAVHPGADGAYRFRTIKPAHYDRRAPHVHFRVVDAAGRELTTQMYFPGEPLNGNDWLYARLGSDALRHAVTAREAAAGRYVWDIVVA
jgi:protocatechuate 3,4-dioxygenase beta subunit